MTCTSGPATGAEFPSVCVSGGQHPVPLSVLSGRLAGDGSGQESCGVVRAL